MTNPIGALFGRSPIRPIEVHMDKAQGSVQLLGDFLTACITQDWEKAGDLYEAIVQAELDADEMKRDIRGHLPKSLFLPFSRSDLLELLRLQDRLADRSRAISHMVLIRRMAIPETLADDLLEYYNLNNSAAVQARTIINELDELLTSGFRGKEVDLVERLIQELDDAERQCERKESELRTSLYQLEDSLSPVDIIFLDKLIDGLRDIMSTAHRIGGQLLLLMSG